jgi:hypothetical protein
MPSTTWISTRATGMARVFLNNEVDGSFSALLHHIKIRMVIIYAKPL